MHFKYTTATFNNFDELNRKKLSQHLPGYAKGDSGIYEKTNWYVNALSNGSISGAVSAGGNLFPDPSLDFATDILIDSPSGLWNNIPYDIYIANKQQAANYMEFRNS